MRKSPPVIALAFLITGLILAFGYMSLGKLVTLVLAAGYLTGFIFWMLTPTVQMPFAVIKTPYWLTLALFVFIHKFEERHFKFFEMVSNISGVPVPEVTSFSLVMLLLVGVVPWLFIPYIVKRGYALGFYFAWTFFAGMGITELAHFVVFPFLVEGPYRYFPGMVSVVLLAPAAWWGMWRLTMASRKDLSDTPH